MELLDRLVSFDTTSRNSNLELIGFIRSYLDAHGVAYRISTDDTGRKANIHATLGAPAQGGIALSGHVDTVPVDGQAWTSDPFALRAEQDRLYGRGTTDMKGFVASALAAVPELLARRLSRPLHLFISYDEETTCNGARRLIEDIAQSGIKPDFCLVGEPSSMKPVIAHKGRLVLRVTVRGAPGHSSAPARGVNAIYAASAAIMHAAAEADRFASRGSVRGRVRSALYDRTCRDGRGRHDPQHHSRERRVPDGMADHSGRRFLRRDRALPVVRAPRHRTRHEAGTSRTRGSASRSTTGYRVCRCRRTMRWLPPSMHLSGTNAVGKVSYGTEAGLYANAGIATIICGPGDIAQAHRPDEWIARSELDACDAFIRRLADRLLA